MTKDANAKDWSAILIASGGRLYSDPANVPGGGGGDTPNLWVNASTGNDATPKAENTELTPWATLGRAVWGSTDRASPNAGEAAAAGDVVSVVGVHSTAGADSSTVTYNPVNEGTSGNPIVFQGSGGAEIYLTSPGIAIGSDGRDYITWRGFTLDDETRDFFVADGLAMVQGPAAGCRFEYINFLGMAGRTEGNNYVGAFNVGTSDGYYVGNCYFRNFRGATSDISHNGCEFYFAVGDWIIEHCEFENCAAAAYIKASYIDDENPTVNGSGTFRYNYIHDGYTGLQHHRAPHTEALPLLFHNNIVADMDEAGIRLQGFNGGDTDPRWLLAINNTFYNCFKGVRQLGEQVANAHCLFQNNIVVGGSYAQTYGDEGPVTHSSDRFQWVRNAYYDQSVAMALFEAGNRSLAQWKTDVSSDTDSVDTAVTFVSAGTDFHLASNGQDALTLGRAIHGIGGEDGTTIPAGAYITGSEVIGIEP